MLFPTHVLKFYPRYELTDGLLQTLVATLTNPMFCPAHQSLVELTLGGPRWYSGQIETPS